MPQFFDWITKVLTRGESVQEAPPSLTPIERPAIERLLRENYQEHALDVAGPPIPFDPVVAIDAAELLAGACWSLVDGNDEPVQLKMKNRTISPSTHLSADLAFRFLPAVYRRAKLHDSAGSLTVKLEQ